MLSSSSAVRDPDVCLLLPDDFDQIIERAVSTGVQKVAEDVDTQYYIIPDVP